ncbi:cupin domain-containing protein [Sandaracinobacteroides hominis]|uniref:hypothetical protein n=1 Tax=Sandaracinobacteroides hominis TaxID=2780086 RepID=UPI0018F3A074|nr:hypothetical protein [Sandaracinobacteroides hominis]
MVGAVAGDPIGHRFENNSHADCVVLAIGNRSEQDVCTYPEIDMKTTTGRYDLAKAIYRRLDGSTYQ